MTGRRPLAQLDPNRVRYSLETRALEEIQRHPPFERLAASVLASLDPARIRRELMASSLRLTASMSPAAHRITTEAATLLGVSGPIEIYQSSGPENAAMHHHREPVLVEIQGRLLSLLDDDCMLGVMGHELGHYLAHGPSSDIGRLELAARVLAHNRELPPELTRAAGRMQVAKELTADRFGLLATQDLDAILRLEMVTTTGLPASDLTWDTRAYLAQCQDLMQACLDGKDAAVNTTHPEHALRAFAAWLFSETREFQEWTGKGPGTRTLAEVDATLDRILLGAELDPAYTPLEAPPPELHECALAASVLVAGVDGEIAPEELETIERVFAPLVEGWQAYLSPDHARTRFEETAPVLRAAGPDLCRALFSLLTHVMGADGAIHEREVGAILLIGAYLGVRPVFSRWMEATLRAIGLDVRIIEAPPPSLPLPARSSDVHDALDAFLDGVARRGSASITLRRLVRLAGAEDADAQALAILEQAFRRRGVDTAPPLHQAKLEDVLSVSSPQVPKAPVAPAPMDTSRAALARGLSRLREQLVSGDGRSPSIRMYATRGGVSFDLFDLEQISVGMAERVLAQVRAGRGARLVDPAESGTHRGAGACAKALLALDRTHKDRLEESGSNDLCLGYPFLSGAVAPQGATTGYTVRAPLVLHPVELERDGRGARGFKLAPRNGEPAVVNHSLLRLLFNKRRDAFPDALAEELDALVAEGGVDALLTKLAELGLGVERRPQALAAFDARDELDERTLKLVVEEHAVLGLFPQSSSDLLQDYDALLQELEDPRADLGKLLAGASLLVPGIAAAAVAAPQKDGDVVPLLFADPTQRAVLETCRQSAGLVVDGPPGTGKSQVIVNLVMDAVRRGERVAVVCEKRAALDVVYQRIDALGLSHAVAVVHDVAEDRKPLYARIGERLDGFQPSAFDERAAGAIADQHRVTEATLEERLACLRHVAPGTKLSVGRLHALQASNTPAEVDARPLAAVPQDRLEPLLALLPRLAPLRDLWGPTSSWRAAPGARARSSFAALDEASLRRLSESLARAHAAAVAYEQALAGARVDPAALERIAPLLATDRQLRTHRADAENAALFQSLLASPDPAGLGGRLEATRAAIGHASQALMQFPEPVSMPDSPELVSSIAIARRWAGTFLRFFVLGWWRASGVVSRVVRASWPDQAGRSLDAGFLDQLNARLVASRAWAAAQALFTQLHIPTLLPRAANGLLPRLDLAARLHGHALTLRRASGDALAIGLPAPGSVHASTWDAAVDHRLDLAARLSALRAALAPLAAFFPWLGPSPTAANVATTRQAFERDAARLVEADALVAQAETLAPGVLAALDSLARAPAGTAESWRQGVLHAWAGAKLATVAHTSPHLARLGTAGDDAVVRAAAQKLDELEGERSKAQIARVRARLDRAPFLNVAQPEKHKRRTPEQAVREDMLKEVRKKRNVMALRTFVRKFAGQGLLDVVPVWLLSPETMTILFPRAPLFDLVVFDEASQCTVESGFPVLLRAKRVVVAGDEKQMPPTSFFKMGSSTDEHDQPGPEPVEELARDVVAAESLLTLARTRLHHAGLAWHYRCHDEALIAFSNHAMYEGELRSIPSTRSRTAESALRWISVPDGTYADGSNEPEARRVAELVHELLADEAPPTIGVVTFNLKQRRTILEALERRAAEDAAFAALWGDALAKERIDERPFVKNLESVQGDERDVIVFSLGHAPAMRRRKDGREDRYVPARFGPLGQRGGERRLNVAVSRAKRGIFVVSSFDPGLLATASAQNAGPKLFREYLEFAHAMSRGQRARADRALARVREGSKAVRIAREAPVSGYLPVATQLALALEAAGISHELDVGASGFRVPVAVLDPTDPQRYELAVLIDEGDEPTTAFEAFVHRPSVLRARGWKVLHVSAATWARSRGSVLDAIRAAVRRD